MMNSILKRPAGVAKRKRFWLRLFALLVFLSIACNVPAWDNPFGTGQTGNEQKGISSEPPTPIPSPTATSKPLPPGVIEMKPAPGSVLSANQPFTMYFNQPMDRASVEADLRVDGKTPARVSWQDDSTLVFATGQTIEPDSEVEIRLGKGVRAKNGLTLPDEARFHFRMASFLKAINVLPLPDGTDIDPASAIMVDFDQPVVPLGGSPETLPSAFIIDPMPQGIGEWINTSTFVFRPDPPLFGGKTYHVRLNENLRSVYGTPLDSAIEWSFTTAKPKITEIKPEKPNQTIRLDTPFRLGFNLAMNQASVEANFSLLENRERRVSGVFGWFDDGRTLVFTPTQLLRRNTDYTLLLNGDAQAEGGTPLGIPVRAQYHTVSALSVIHTKPGQGGKIGVYDGVEVKFTAPLKPDQDFARYLSVQPAVTNLAAYYSGENRTLYIRGDFLGSAEYHLRIDPGIEDPWGGVLRDAFELSFVTKRLRSDLTFTSGMSTIFVMPNAPVLQAQGTNLYRLDMKMGNLPLEDFGTFFGKDGYDSRKSYVPASVKEWPLVPDLPENRSAFFDVPLTSDGSDLAPGLYFLSMSSPDLRFSPQPLVVLSSNVHLTFKVSHTNLLVWAVDLRTMQAVADAPVEIYNANRDLLTSGRTDAQGVFEATLSQGSIADLYQPVFAVLARPGDERFSLSLSTWNTGIDVYDFALPSDTHGEHLKAYIYTDRPIYRPGDAVRYRVIARNAYNGRYTLPAQETITMTVHGAQYKAIDTIDLALSAFGTGNGAWKIPENAQPGTYQFVLGDDRIEFQVADYRKPEIDLHVGFDQDEALAGQALTAKIDARYYFDAPAGNVPVVWTLSAFPEGFSLPGYEVGLTDDDWLFPGWMMGYRQFGVQLAAGKGVTDGNGQLEIRFSDDDLKTDYCRQACRYELEATLTDESGHAVSARSQTLVHPARFYAGVHPDVWVGKAEREIGFNVQLVDWKKAPYGEQNLHADFQKVRWVPEKKKPLSLYEIPEYKKVTETLASTDFRTAVDGRARIAFTPPEPGLYQLEVSGDGARTQVLLWVGGAGQTVWPSLLNQHLHLVADKDAYQPGSHATVFIPNPFTGPSQVLLTIERGEILNRKQFVIDGPGKSIDLSLTGDDAPNVFVSVTLIGTNDKGVPDFRQGYLDLKVAADAFKLNLKLLSEPKRIEPGGNLAFDIQVSDAQGSPVQGEFSLSVVDEAVLALADENAEDIFSAFYGAQGLGVRTGVMLSVYSRRQVYLPGGLGGGDGSGIPPGIRHKFLDTAYWNAAITTDENGKATVEVPFPDNLTTWRILVRGLTADTRVGELRTEVITSKDLLIRPVTPRFFVAGDHVQLAAVVHNNTDRDLLVTVGMQAAGFVPDDAATETQIVAIPANSRYRVTWWGVVQDVENVALVFAAEVDGLTDAARPEMGKIPVRRYLAARSFGTAGMISEQGEREELVSLPRTFDPQGGDLKVELSPSLGAVLLSSLDALDKIPDETTEQAMSHFLPNLAVYEAYQNLGLSNPELHDKLTNTLTASLQHLLAAQNDDGGWGWWQGEKSNLDLSSYVLFGLLRARKAGLLLDDLAINRAESFLTDSLPASGESASPWLLDRLAFEAYVLTNAKERELPLINGLYARREQLSPWAKALLALSMQITGHDSDQQRTLLSDLEAMSVRSAAGVHWEASPDMETYRTTANFNTAVVLYAIARLDAGSALVPGAVRYLVANRSETGCWASSYETSWVVMALSKVMENNKELAGSFDYAAMLNEIKIAQGTASDDSLNSVTASVPVSGLRPDYPNSLVIQHGEGNGVLYYSAYLNVLQPVESVEPLNKGIVVQRQYFPGPKSCSDDKCAQIEEGKLGDVIRVELNLTLDHDIYALMVEDVFPAGAEIVDFSLKTSEQNLQLNNPEEAFDAEKGWGWWYFTAPQYYRDHVVWAADYLPAGTYQLTYLLRLDQAGDYRVLPARAWEITFPDVQGTSAGRIFRIHE